MTEIQITANEVISAVCRAIYDTFGDNLSIYKEEQEKPLDLPAVAVYCANYGKKVERFDRYVNNFNIIINYYSKNEDIINNKGRTTMFSEAEKIAECIKYIQLPAYRKENDNLVPFKLPNRRNSCYINEREGFIQIDVRYTVRTKYVDKDNTSKMPEKIITNINGYC